MILNYQDTLRYINKQYWEIIPNYDRKGKLIGYSCNYSCIIELLGLPDNGKIGRYYIGHIYAQYYSVRFGKDINWIEKHGFKTFTNWLKYLRK